MNARHYLDRIHYAGPTEPVLQTLRQIHLAHLMTVPFENLSVLNKQTVVLDEAALYDKIVTRKRGGFCYELNGLLAWLLRALGFQVTLLSARVANDDGNLSPEFDHLVLQVSLADPWLLDVGFGDCFGLPLRLNTSREQVQAGSAFRIVQDGAERIMLRRDFGKPWREEYRFTLQPRQFDEFGPMCIYHQTSPESPFTHRRVCSRNTPNGRITISDMRLISTCFGQRTERLLRDEAELSQVLQTEFGIQV